LRDIPSFGGRLLAGEEHHAHRALPDVIRSYASAARSGGMVSIIGRVDDCTEKRTLPEENDGRP
jgi:hypothetical protein